jgi:hypothetical protein
MHVGTFFLFRGNIYRSGMDLDWPLCIQHVYFENGKEEEEELFTRVTLVLSSFF